MSNRKNKKVLVAMSGGVDSSVSAALLKEQGYDVSGVFMIFQKSELPVCHCDEGEARRGNPEFCNSLSLEIAASLPEFTTYFDTGVAPCNDNNENKCCSQEAMERARQVATKLNIPFYVMDFSVDFQKRVIDYFISECKNGRTPNPCVMCNKFIKLGLLLDKALALGFDYVATGHYVKLTADSLQPTNDRRPLAVSRKPYALYEARDKSRDQSYFLYTLTQDKLARSLFPLGNYLKSQVWQLAKDRNLPIPKTESHGICFIKDNNVADFLARVIKFKKGLIKDIKTQKALGEHRGLQLYTIGQRQAIGIGGTGPFYVVKLDLAGNTLWVTNNSKDSALFADSLVATDVNWISGQKPQLPFKCQARIRYGHKIATCVVDSCHCERWLKPGIIVIPSIARNLAGASSETRCDPRTKDVRSFVGLRPPQDDNNRLYRVKFSKPQRAITPGQSIVFYGQRHEMLGGGIIN